MKKQRHLFITFIILSSTLSGQLYADDSRASNSANSVSIGNSNSNVNSNNSSNHANEVHNVVSNPVIGTPSISTGNTISPMGFRPGTLQPNVAGAVSMSASLSSSISSKLVVSFKSISEISANSDGFYVVVGEAVIGNDSNTMPSRKVELVISSADVNASACFSLATSAFNNSYSYSKKLTIVGKGKVEARGDNEQGASGNFVSLHNRNNYSGQFSACYLK